MTEAAARAEERLTLAPRLSGTRTEVRLGRGLLGRLPELLSEHAPAPAYAVVSDENVARLYGAAVRDALEGTGAGAELFSFPAGESSKTPARWAELVEGLGAMGLGRDGCVVALGGGVTGDLAGFAAASYARGVKLVQVATSLLAMIDASIGGKTGLDLRAGKNLAGAFYDPVLVVTDPQLLDTLPDNELRAGLAEAVKHGAIADPGYLEMLEASAAAILRRDPDAVDRVVARSVRIKVAVVERDARESGERETLNFGHTIAHGIEGATRYAVAHGRAVAIGMVVESRIGEGLGVTRAGTADALRGVLESLGLPVGLPAGVDPAAVLAGTRSDKKGRAGAVRYALIEAIGTPARTSSGGWSQAVEDGAVMAALADTDPVS